jgi:hypothetical protein
LAIGAPDRGVAGQVHLAHDPLGNGFRAEDTLIGIKS